MNNPVNDRAMTEAEGEHLRVIARDAFALSGDVHQLVTFLNRALKDDGYVFGLRRAPDDRFQLTVYRA